MEQYIIIKYHIHKDTSLNLFAVEYSHPERWIQYEKSSFFSPIFPVFSHFFSSKSLASRLFLHENRVWRWKKSFGCQHFHLTMPMKSSVRMIGQLPFRPMHKQLIYIPIKWFCPWKIWSIHQARRELFYFPTWMLFINFLCYKPVFLIQCADFLCNHG